MRDTPDTDAPSGCTAALAVLAMAWIGGLLCGAGVVWLWLR
jgi:hypothetical protein